MAAFDVDRLHRRFKFLDSRAEAHLDSAQDLPDDPHRLCAATLYRDAAAIAALLGNDTLVNETLSKAGQLFAKGGWIYGYALLALTEPEQHLDLLSQVLDRTTNRILAAQNDSLRYDSSDGLDEEGPVPGTSELFYLYQGALLSKLDAELSIVGKWLNKAPDVAIGDLGFPVSDYIVLAHEEMPKSSATDETDADIVFDEIMTMRRRRLRLARADTWHWERLTAPAMIVDFDLVAAFKIHQRRGSELGPYRDRTTRFSEREPLLDLPLSVCEMLRN